MKSQTILSYNKEVDLLKITFRKEFTNHWYLFGCTTHYSCLGCQSLCRPYQRNWLEYAQSGRCRPSSTGGISRYTGFALARRYFWFTSTGWITGQLRPESESGLSGRIAHILALQFHAEVAADSLEKWLIGHTCELRQAQIDIPALRANHQQYAPQLQQGQRDDSESVSGRLKISKLTGSFRLRPFIIVIKKAPWSGCAFLAVLAIIFRSNRSFSSDVNSNLSTLGTKPAIPNAERLNKELWH